MTEKQLEELVERIENQQVGRSGRIVLERPGKRSLVIERVTFAAWEIFGGKVALDHQRTDALSVGEFVAEQL